jgi:uncharacterized protein
MIAEVEGSSEPVVRYHPAPRETGSAVADGRPCSLCGTARGFRHNGPIYGRQAEVVCLVCVHSGRASEVLAVGDRPAEFTDVGVGVPDGYPPKSS